MSDSTDGRETGLSLRASPEVMAKRLAEHEATRTTIEVSKEDLKLCWIYLSDLRDAIIGDLEYPGGDYIAKLEKKTNELRDQLFVVPIGP